MALALAITHKRGTYPHALNRFPAPAIIEFDGGLTGAGGGLAYRSEPARRLPTSGHNKKDPQPHDTNANNCVSENWCYQNS